VNVESNLPPEYLLFHESPSRILLSTSHAETIGRIAAKHDVELTRIGVTMKERLRIQNGPVTLIDCDIATLHSELPL
jgi:hypothetical protein